MLIILFRLLGQIQKDQDILVRPDYYKKPFLSARQVKERLLRYHLYYKSEPYKAYRVLQGMCLMWLRF